MPATIQDRTLSRKKVKIIKLKNITLNENKASNFEFEV